MLEGLEAVKSDAQNKPLEDLTITSLLVLNNPYRDTIAEILAKDWKIMSKEHQNKIEVDKYEAQMKRQKVSKSDQVGKYMWKLLIN